MTLPEYVLAFLVGTLATARLVRAVAYDSFPPSEWLRNRWDNFTGSRERLRPWNSLIHCSYCLSPYFAAGLAAWALLSDFHWSWWVFCSVASAAYIAAIIPASDWG